MEGGYKVKLERTNPLAVVSREEGIAKSGKKIDEFERSGPIVHRKRFPARRAGERARVPDDHTFRTYFHPLGRICVLICSDAIDINQFLNIIRYNEEAGPLSLNRIFMVIVPTFNQSTFLLDACKDLSALARTNVLVTNALGTLQIPGNPPYTEKLIEGEFFFDGRPLGYLMEKGVATYVPSSDPTVQVFDLNIKFQRDVIRQKVQDS